MPGGVGLVQRSVFTFESFDATFVSVALTDSMGNKMGQLRVMALAAALFVAAAGVSASTVDFTYQPGDSHVSNSVYGLTTSIVDSSASATLATGDAFTFDAIRFSGSTWSGFYQQSGSLEAHLSFTPPGVTVPVDGSASGVVAIYGSLVRGEATWGVVNFFDSMGSEFSLSLASMSFRDCGGFLQAGCVSQATVTAVNVIPLPATAWLLLASLAGLGMVAHRKRSWKAAA